MELKAGLFAGIVAGICVGFFLSLNLLSPDQTLESFTLTKAVTSIVIWSVVLGFGGVLGAAFDAVIKRDSWNTMAVIMSLYTYGFYLATLLTVGVPNGMKPNSFPILEMLIVGLSAAFGYNHMLNRGTPLERPARTVKQENLFEFTPIRTEVGLPPKTLECYRLAKAIGGTALMTDSSRKVRVDHPFVTEIIFDEMTIVQQLLNPNFVFGLPGINIFEFPNDVKVRVKEALGKYRHYYTLRCRTLNRFPHTEFYSGLFSSDKPALSEQLNDGELIKTLLQANIYYMKLDGDKLIMVAASRERTEMLVKALQMLQKALDGKGFAVPLGEQSLSQHAAVSKPAPTPAPEGQIRREEVVRALVATVKPQKAPLTAAPSSVVQRVIDQHAPRYTQRQYEAEKPQPAVVEKPIPVEVVAEQPRPQQRLASQIFQQRSSIPQQRQPMPQQQRPQAAPQQPEKRSISEMIWRGGPAKKPEPQKTEQPKPEEKPAPHHTVIKPIPLRKE